MSETEDRATETLPSAREVVQERLEDLRVPSRWSQYLEIGARAQELAPSNVGLIVQQCDGRATEPARDIASTQERARPVAHRIIEISSVAHHPGGGVGAACTGPRLERSGQLIQAAAREPVCGELEGGWVL